MELETLNRLDESKDKHCIKIILYSGMYHINDYGMMLIDSSLEDIKERARDYLENKFKIEKNRVCFNL